MDASHEPVEGRLWRCLFRLTLRAPLRSLLALPPRPCAVLLAVVWLLLPAGGGTESQLRQPVRYFHTQLAAYEPVVLELDLPPGECQVAPASLGYFSDEASSGLRRFVFSAEVPRGLIYLYHAEPGSSSGTVYLIEISAPDGGEVYFEDQLALIRRNVIELNRQRNLLLQAKQQMSSSRSNYSKSLDALWAALYITPLGLRDGGWRERVLQKHPSEINQLSAQLLRDAEALGAQKALYYAGQRARLTLLLSQYDLQRGLAKLPRRRSEELLSLGNAQLVQETVLAEIERLQLAWEQRRQELAQDCEVARGLQSRLPRAPSGFTPSGAGNWPENAVQPAPELGAVTPDPKQVLEAAMLTGWLGLQEAELAALHEALPALDEARQHVNSRQVPDWASLPRLSVGVGQLAAPRLEELRHYSALDSGLAPNAAADLLAGLARQFETRADADSGALPQAFGAENRLRQTVDGLTSGALNAAPDEVRYGLLVVDRCRATVVTADAPTTVAEPAAAQLALRRELDRIMQQPDSRGLAAFDLAYIKFMRWYCGLGLPAEALAEAAMQGASELRTQSYGFKAADQSP